MKKGLSLFLAASLAVSSFSTAALAADELTAEEKYNALVQAGIFDGFPDGQAHLDLNMTRAQAAKVITLILGLDENPAAASVYSDLAGAEWAAGYIGAATAAGILQGRGGGIFDPSANVTIQELAKILVEALDIEVDPDATVSGADDWAGPYVAAALNAGLIPQQSDYTAPATRQLLVEASYEAHQVVNEPAQAGIQSAAPTGVRKVTVQLSKAVDTSKATLTLRKGTATIAATTAWSEDGRSATLTLSDTKISAGDYTVTLSGVEDIDASAATASFTAQDERIEKLDFITASDTIAYAESVVVKAAAFNQYGEPASLNAASYTVYASPTEVNASIKRAEDGTLLVELSTDLPAPNDNLITPGVSVIPITIVNNDNHITVTRNFKVGVQPIISKAELGTARYSSGSALTGKGQNVKFDFHLYDQYGNDFTWKMLEKEAGDTHGVNLVWNTYVSNNDVEWTVEDNGDNIPQIKISLKNNIDKSGDYSFTVYKQAASATGSVAVKSAKVATKVQIGDVDKGIAAGDTNVWVPIIAYDEEGNQLSIEDLTSDENVDRISFSVSGTDTPNPKIAQAGNDKGKINIGTIGNQARGSVTVTAIIATPNAQSTATKTFSVQGARYPDLLKEIKAPAKAIVKDATSSFRLNVFDQYGYKLNTFKRVDSNGNVVTAPNGSEYTLEVYTTVYKKDGNTTDNSKLQVQFTKDNAAVSNDPANPTKFPGDYTVKEFNDNDFKFVAVNGQDLSDLDRIVFTVRIMKDDKEVSKLTRTVNVTDVANESLSYNVTTAESIFNALDNASVTSAVYGPGTNNLNISETFTTDPDKVKLAHEVKVTATNNAGETVALPGVIQNIISSNPLVAQVSLKNGKAYVLGYKTGTATLNVVYSNLKGETKQTSLNVTVKNDPVVVTKLERTESSVTLSHNNANGAIVPKLMKLKATDNYGATYESNDSKDEINQYNFLLGITYSVQNVVSSDGTTVSVDKYGVITKNGNGQVEFDVVATSASGQSVTTAFKLEADAL